MNYFPNITSELWGQAHDLMWETVDLEQNVVLERFSHLSRSSQGLVDTVFSLGLEGYIVAHQLGQEICFPNPIPRIKLPHLVSGYTELIFRKYNLPGFVEVESDDTVFEVGAFVGGFTVEAGSIAERVIAFEPEPRNFICLKTNVRQCKSVDPIMKGVGAVTGTSRLNLSKSAVEHSFLRPDEGETGETIQVKMTRLDDFCHDLGITQIDFLKLEAEGLEIEVFEGLGEVRPLKLAIDVSPERNGQSPEKYFREILRHDYELAQRGNVLFAKLFTPIKGQ